MEPTLELGALGFYAQLLILVFSLLAVAFFSSSEASLISVNKFRIRHLVEQGHRAAKAVSSVVNQHEKFFATILLTENAFIILATSVGTAFAITVLGRNPYSVIVAAVTMTLIVVIFGEITPKSLAARASERWSLVIGRPIKVVMALETPILFFFTLLPRLLLKLMGGAGKLVTPSVTEGELRMLIDIARAEGMMEHQEASMLERVFQFGDRQVREVMTPRNEIIWVEKGTPLKAFLATYAEHYHTRFPIYEEIMDNVTGILSSKDVLREMASGRLKPEDSVTHLSRATFFAPETKPIGELFFEMRHQRTQMAMAVDEFGGVAGLVTLKQLIEVVAGSLMEEGVHIEEQVLTLDEVTYQVDGGLRIDEANERLGLNIPSGEYETLAGFLLKTLGHMPKEGESVDHEGRHIKVVQMKGVKIERLLVTLAAPSARDAKTQGIS